ncbi:uncharacterized protein BJX67DRAFT_98787 [Aspergillus lucknowensis]|uniref:Pre-mRNA splicing factor CLF1 n=1 Tax=Aspergillus lucknowensis TaxID=176173 RepID=A0ABR4M673_9EURO
MIVPKPPVALEGHCSVIHDNTLYTYSEEGFASIPLERNGTWSKLTPGVPVSGAACVTGGIDGNESQQALYVVGGTSSRSKNPGLQRYSFKDKTWKTIPLTGPNLSNRTSHSAVYLKSISSIFVYGGHPEDGAIVTSDTFIARTYSPYDLDSQSGADASPAAAPVLLPWSDEEAALFGGLTTPEGVHFWDASKGWHDSGFTMGKELPSDAKYALLNRTDGSMVLQTFDMSVSPNTVTSTIMMPPQSSKESKRDGYPEYDGSLASKSTRQDYSIAQGDNGLVVVSSGSGTDSLAIFNQTSNSWTNTTKLFYGDKPMQDILGTTTLTADNTTTSTTPEPTASETNSTSPTASTSSNDDSDNNNIGTIVGATVGGVLGVAAILVLILFLLKRKKEKMRRAGRLDKDRLSFQDQGVEPLTRSAYPMAQGPAPAAASSMDSLAIFSGNAGDEKSPRSAGSIPHYMQKSHLARPSPLNNIQSSDAGNYSRDDKTFAARDLSVRPGDQTTDEGWGKYFQDTTTPNFVGMQPQYESTRGSKATLWPGASNGLTPLNTSFLEQPKPLGRVHSGSPTTEFATSARDGRQIAIVEGQSAQISSADSVSLHSEDDDPNRGYGAQTQSWLGRPPSSTYSRSYYNPNQSTRELPSTATPTTTDYRKHDSARTNTRGSSILIPDGQPLPRSNVNSDMSWLNLHADR